MFVQINVYKVLDVFMHITWNVKSLKPFHVLTKKKAVENVSTF